VSDRAARGVAAAVSAAEQAGLRVSRPVVLRALSSVLVRLEPYPLVARAAVSGAGAPRPGGLARTVREARVVAHLAARGAPTVTPSPLLPPGPYVCQGVPVGIFARLPSEPTRALDGPAMGSSLRATQEALATYPGSLPRFPHLAETRGWLDRAEVQRAVPAPLRARMRTAVDRAEEHLARREPAFRPLHGDAHSGNALLGPDGPRWADLEDACLGPVEWDLACLVTTSRFSGGNPRMAREALEAYGGHDPVTLEVLVAARAAMVVAWSVLAAAVDPRRLRGAQRRTSELEAVLA